MIFLNYSNTAPPVALTTGVGNGAGDTSLEVGSTAGYPTAPFLLALERGTASEEIVLCTAVPDATHFTVVRGYDGTTRKTHGITAPVEHTVAALNYRGAGVVIFTTTERNALAGDNLWNGRTIFNSTMGELQTYNSTTTNWVGMNQGVVHYGAEGTLSVRSGKGRLRFPWPVVILGITPLVDTAPTGASLIIDVHRSGTTIFTTQGNRPTIAASSNGGTEVTNMDVVDVSTSQHLTIDIDQVGSTVAGADLGVAVRYRRTG